MKRRNFFTRIIGATVTVGVAAAMPTTKKIEKQIEKKSTRRKADGFLALYGNDRLEVVAHWYKRLPVKFEVYDDEDSFGIRVADPIEYSESRSSEGISVQYVAILNADGSPHMLMAGQAMMPMHHGSVILSGDKLIMSNIAFHMDLRGKAVHEYLLSLRS